MSKKTIINCDICQKEIDKTNSTIFNVRPKVFKRIPYNPFSGIFPMDICSSCWSEMRTFIKLKKEK